MDWQIPLLVSTLTFAAFLVFRMRPAVTPRARERAAELAVATKRIEASKDDRARALALADAADACVALGRMDRAAGYYQRALRSDPCAAQIVERTAAGLARRPSALERLMWRHLAAHAWQDEGHDAALAGLRTLERIYAKRPRHRTRAQAIARAIAALGGTPPSA